jgi:orotidine-5'-phosphate decarboxylase
MIPFNHRLSDAVGTVKSHLCIGIDVTPEALNVDDTDINALIDHSRKIVSATRDLATAYKPNLGFFERFGSRGFAWLEELVQYIGSDKLIIGDAKRGDIGNTAKQYASALFEHFNFDAVTLNPYLGEDSIKPFLDYPGKGVFILCKTSNPSASSIQNKTTDGQFLFEHVAKMAVALNDHENVGLVVGATVPDDITVIRSIAPSLSLLIPGVGAQGGELETSLLEGNKEGVALINVSRSINFAGDLSEEAIRDSALQYVNQMRTILNG